MDHVWIITSVRHSVNQRGMVLTVGALGVCWVGIVGVTVGTVVDIMGQWCYTIEGWGVLLRRIVHRPV